MATEKRLAFSIVQFLRDHAHCGSLNSDEQESIEGTLPFPLSNHVISSQCMHNDSNDDSSSTVAIQCLETTFKVSSSDCHLAVPQTLPEIFQSSLLKVCTLCV